MADFYGNTHIAPMLTSQASGLVGYSCNKHLEIYQVPHMRATINVRENLTRRVISCTM